MAKLIKVSDSTYYKLADYGKWTDSMDDIVKRLMKEAGFGHKNLTASGEHKGQ